MTELPSRLAALVHELKRRRVLNVAAVYLIGMWGVIQVADITFTRLGLPDWTVTFVIVLGALMFPVLVALAWVFDLTSTGLTRTPKLPSASDDAAQPPGPLPSAGAHPHPHQRRVAVVGAALMALPLLGFGLWWTGARGMRGADLAGDLVAVTPFRLAGASAELGYLREGLMDLIAARIGGAGSELSVVAPRSVSRRIKDTMGSLDADPDRDEARGLATHFGAGLLLEGEIVGTPAAFTVTARLIDVRTGYRLDAAELEAHPDSLHELVDRIAARLVAAESGLRGDRLAALTTASLPALRAFLDGEQAFRRGSHDQAVRGYDRAVTLDSTFALAALGLLRARGWAVGLVGDNDSRAEAIVRRGLDRLSEADRLYFHALVGEDGPETLRHLVDLRVAAARRMPESAELQYLAGDGLLHYGEALGAADGFDASEAYFRRTVELDSTYVEPLIHLHDMAFNRADTTGMRRYGRLLLAIDSVGPVATGVHHAWRRRGMASPAAAMDLDTLDYDHLTAAGFVGFSVEAPEEAFITALQGYLSESATLAERVRAAEPTIWMGFLTGRPSLVDRARDILEGAGRSYDVDRLAAALYWLQDVEAARAAAAEVESALQAARRQANPEGPVPYAVTARACMLGHLSVALRDVAGATARAASLEGAIRPDRDPWANAYDRVCAEFLRTAAAVHGGAPDALARLEALHDSLGDGARRPPALHAVYDLATSGLWENLGRPERALEAVRRRVHLPSYIHWHTHLDGEQARLAERLGHQEEAMAGYARYVNWMQHAEGPLAERAERARQALERLRGRG